MPTEKKARARAYQREWYKKNKDKRDAANDRWEKKNVEFFKALKKELSCVRCGETEPTCIEFHHEDPTLKDFDIATAVRRYSIDRVVEEMAKCLILCANCHRKEHARLKKEFIGE